MPWVWDRLKRLANEDAIGLIDQGLDRLQRAIVAPNPYVNVRYENPVVIDAERAIYRFFRLSVTNTSPFTISRPINGQDGAKITVNVVNASGGVMGAITWASEYIFLADWVNPDPGTHANATFVKLGHAIDGPWVQIASGAAGAGAGIDWTLVVKQADESITSDTGLSNDAELLVPVTAGQKIHIRGKVMLYSADPTENYKYGLVYTGTYSDAWWHRRHTAFGAAAGTDAEETDQGDGTLPTAISTP